MSASHQHHSPSHAGSVLLKQCEGMRASLRERLVKPDEGDSAALEAHIAAKVAINRMDHKELRAAVLDSSIAA